MLVPSNSTSSLVRSVAAKRLCGYLAELTSAARTLGCLPDSGEAPETVREAVRSCWHLADVVEDIHSTPCRALRQVDGTFRFAVSHRAPSHVSRQGGTLWVGHSPFAECASLSELAGRVQAHLRTTTSCEGSEGSLFTADPGMEETVLEINVVTHVPAAGEEDNLVWTDLAGVVEMAKKLRSDRVQYRLKLLAKRVERARKQLIQVAFDGFLGPSGALRLLEVGDEERDSLGSPLRGVEVDSSEELSTPHQLPSSPRHTPTDFVLPATPVGSPTMQDDIFAQQMEREERAKPEPAASRIHEFINLSAGLSPTESLCALLKNTTLVLERASEDPDNHLGRKRVRHPSDRFRCRVDFAPQTGDQACTHSQPCLGNMELLFVVADSLDGTASMGLPPNTPVRLWCCLCTGICSEPTSSRSNTSTTECSEVDHMPVVPLLRHEAMSPDALIPLSRADATDVALYGSAYDILNVSPHDATQPGASKGVYLAQVVVSLKHSLGYSWQVNGGPTHLTAVPVERLLHDPWEAPQAPLQEEAEGDAVTGLLQCPLYFCGVETGRAYPHMASIDCDAASVALTARLCRWFVMPLRMDVFVLPPHFKLPDQTGGGVVSLTLFSCEAAESDATRRGSVKLLKKILSGAVNCPTPSLGLCLTLERGNGDSTLLAMMTMAALEDRVMGFNEGVLSLLVGASPLPLDVLSPVPRHLPIAHPCFAPLHGIAAFVDLDRTLIDNSPTLCEQLEHETATTHIEYRVWTRGEAIERKETLVLRPGVRTFLRRLVAAGVLLIMVTKSKRARARAALNSLVDPDHDLFGPLLLNEFGPLSPQVMCSEDLAAAAHSYTCTNVLKSISRVVTFYHTTLDQHPPKEGVSRRRPLTRCFVMDDTPADWVPEDLPSLIHVWPFTLGGGWTNNRREEEAEWVSGHYAYAVALSMAKLALAGLDVADRHEGESHPGKLLLDYPAYPHPPHTPKAGPSKHVENDLSTITVPREFEEYNPPAAEVVCDDTDDVPVSLKAPVVEEAGIRAFATPERSKWDGDDVEEVVPL